MNPSILVLVGGPAFLENPDLAGRIGADATAADAPSAVRCATDLLNRHTNV
jgi:methanogenic corrinoid protein MtbC1